MRPIYFYFIFFLFVFTSCSTSRHKFLKLQPDTSISRLQFLGEYVIPHHIQFKNTIVGGLSGIDYDAKNNLYYIISDDRSDINPARFYTAKIDISATGIKRIKLTDVKTWRRKNGNIYPNLKQNPSETPDPEAIRYNPVTQQLVWSSEGERIVKNGDTILVNPTITITTKKGKYISTFLLPQNLQMQAIEKGPRQNGVLEGLTFTNNYENLFTSLEEPLYEDAPRADIEKNDYYVRIFKFAAEDKQNVAQYAYKLEAISNIPNPPDGYRNNGITDILDLGNNKLLITERSNSEGKGFSAKLFVANLSNAENIITLPSLLKNPPRNVISKKMLLDTDDLKMYIDNIEGATFGPNLPNGHRSLILLTDNNFNPKQKTQFLLFEVFP